MANKRDSQIPSPWSPSQSTEAGSRLHSPWLLDPLSPDLRNSTFMPRKQDSRMELLGHGQDAEARAGLGVFHPADLGNKGSQPDTWWKKAIKSKWSMVIFLLLGVGSTLGHHFLYNHLHGREDNSQEWWLRLGQFISFVAKANFVVSILMAHQQVVWRSIGRQDYSVDAINSLFGAVHNVTELFNREAWGKSWFLMFLAIYIWASPLVVIFTSATLSVRPGMERQDNVNCQSVRTLNFSHERTNVWNKPTKAKNQSLLGLSLSFWNTTFDGDDGGPDGIEYWTSPSVQFSAIASKALYGKEAIQRDGVAMDVCGSGWNCSTTINFLGPGYRCDIIAEGKDDTIKKYGGITPPRDLNMSMLAPNGNFTYIAVADEGEYAGEQVELGGGENGNKPLQDPPYPQNLGAFRTEPLIWLGYSEADDFTVEYSKNWTQEKLQSHFTPRVFACEHWEVNYTVNLNYTGGLQAYTVLDRGYMRKLIDTTYVRGNKSVGGTMDETVATPESNYVRPQDGMEDYRLTAAYHSLGKELRDFIKGTLKQPFAIANGKFLSSRLLDRHDWLAVPNLEDVVRDLYEDLIISLFSDPQILAVSWAANPSERTGVAKGGAETAYPCVRERTANFFHYRWQTLVGVYSASFFIALVAVIYGISAMYKDGVKEQREMNFASLVEEANKRMSLSQEDYRRSKIGYGPMDDASSGRAVPVVREP
ncbi:hypothetical protein FALBO_13133 [Fusarium albosuccineum]|uniref:Uncharacterized protein n=1 Tax=Fusarium albosuccineum TaxID=1237068 RepID=A0A8H4KZ61_9HYPO|nr:hypothetical protein FALBO_13133 [Fusarium albosuccineum]